MKRFWQAVDVGPDRIILLDGRPVRTPGRAALALPNDALAGAIAEEWRGVGETVDPRAMPLTGLANAAIDRIGPDTATFAADLSSYGETDLLCYRAQGPAELVARQHAAWDPLLNWAAKRYDVVFAVTEGVIHAPQPAATVPRLRALVAGLDAFTLAGLHPVVTVTGSLVLALALLDGAADAERVWLAARVDDDWQAEQWGEDALAVEATATRRRDYDAGARFLALLERTT